MTQQSAFELRDTGMALARDAQEQKAPGWTDLAYRAIESVARSQATVHVDDVARVGEGWLPEPAHANAWGSVWQKAIRRGLILRSGSVRPAGGSYKAHAHKHGRAYPVYMSLVFGKAPQP